MIPKSQLTIWLALIPGWMLLVLAVHAPQWLASRDSVALGVLLATLLLAAFACLLVWIGLTLIRGLIGAGLGVAYVAMMHGFGSESFQQALLLAQGRTLDGVTLDEALAQREAGVWVRITDARVRSDASHDLTFRSGGGRNADGTPRAETYTTVALAPVTPAADVTQEEPVLRRRLTGNVPLWACASSSFTLAEWDRERQAVRGHMAPMESHVRASLFEKLRPPSAAPIPGAGAIPAAPGALEPAREYEAPAQIRLTDDAWCVELDRALDADAAREQAVGTMAVLILTIPVFVMLFAFAVARISETPAKR